MKLIQVHDKAIVLVLNQKEAEKVLYRLQNGNGVMRSKPEIKAEEKLLVAMGKI